MRVPGLESLQSGEVLPGQAPGTLPSANTVSVNLCSRRKAGGCQTSSNRGQLDQCALQPLHAPDGARNLSMHTLYTLNDIHIE